MRIWSLHPRYLDAKGLVALWRETLLAKHVLEGRTRGYRDHPQLQRFKQADNPVDRIDQYLAAVHEEASARHYHFDAGKVNWDHVPAVMPVTRGQLRYETEHLLGKLRTRDAARYRLLKEVGELEQHPLFRIVDGDVEPWEVR